MTAPFSTSNAAGFNFSATYTVPQTYYPDDDQPPVPAGTVAKGTNGTEFVFCKTTAAVTAGDVCQISKTFTVAGLTTATGTLGNQVGVPLVSIASGDYGWVQVYGVCQAINVAASCAANAALNSTATAGRIDDDGTTGALILNGIVITTAAGGSATTEPGILTYPIVGAAHA